VASDHLGYAGEGLGLGPFLDHFPSCGSHCLRSQHGKGCSTSQPHNLVVVSLPVPTSCLYRMWSSGSETSSSDSGVGKPTQALPQRGTTLASKRKGAYEPPQGAVLMGGGPGDGAGAIDTGEFDWNSVKDDDIELWLVRVPNSVCLRLNLFFLFSAGLASDSGLVSHRSRGLQTVERGGLMGLISAEPHTRSKISHMHRSSPSISTAPFSTPLPRRPHILSAKLSGDTSHTTCGHLVTVITTTPIMTRLAATR